VRDTTPSLSDYMTMLVGRDFIPETKVESLVYERARSTAQVLKESFDTFAMKDGGAELDMLMGMAGKRGWGRLWRFHGPMLCPKCRASYETWFHSCKHAREARDAD